MVVFCYYGFNKRHTSALVYSAIFLFFLVFSTNFVPIFVPVNAHASPLTSIYLPLVVSNTSLTAPRASWSTPIADDPNNNLVWVVNPDSGSISAIDTLHLTATIEIPVGKEPWSLALGPTNNLYVVDRAGGTLIVVDTIRHYVRARLPVGPEPVGLALSPAGATAYITISSANEIAVVDVNELRVVKYIAIPEHPYAIAVSNDGDTDDADEHIYVTHLQAFARPGGVETTDNERVGRVTVLDAATNRMLHTIDLAPDVHGFPNLLTGISLSADRAWIPHVRAAPALPNDLSTTVFAAIATIDRITDQENGAEQLALNDQDVFGSPVNNPVAVVPSPDNKTLYIVLAGSDMVEVVDVAAPQHPQLVKFLPTGSNPRGMTISADGNRGYVMSYLSRTVTVLDLEQLVPITTIPVTHEALDPLLLRGKILFNNATNPQLARVSWISCASCHVDGASDGVTWMFPDGPRQTPQLWNAGQTLPWHWSAALDEPQDIEFTIQEIQHGVGLAPGADPPLLSTPNAGRSVDLDALAMYLTRGIRIPNIPTVYDKDEKGRKLFIAAGCATCHGGSNWTISALPGVPGTLDADHNGMVDAVLRNVGTVNTADLRGATGFDVPSLIDVRMTAPYLHDGSMPTLEALLTSGHPRPHKRIEPFSTDDLAALVTFLRSIGPNTPPIVAP